MAVRALYLCNGRWRALSCAGSPSVVQDPAIRGTGGTGVLPTVVFTEAVFPVAILPIDDSDSCLAVGGVSGQRAIRNGLGNPRQWLISPRRRWRNSAGTPVVDPSRGRRSWYRLVGADCCFIYRKHFVRRFLDSAFGLCTWKYAKIWVGTDEKFYSCQLVCERQLVFRSSLFAPFSAGSSHFPTRSCTAGGTWSTKRRRLGGTNNNFYLLVI